MLSVQFFTFNPFQENSYVVFDAFGNAIIIDPGCYTDAEKASLSKFISEKKLTVNQLINTHCHLDHVFGNAYVANTYKQELYLHKNEEQVLQFAPQAGAMYATPFVSYTGALHFLNEGDVVTVGEEKLVVLNTPGHSPGSICLYSKADGFVIGGDVLFRESIGRTDLPGGNHQVLLDSIRDKLYALPDDVICYSGHGPSTTIGHEKKNNPFVRG